jgi:hypothetical protein
MRWPREGHVSYSYCMETTKAPDLTPGYPSKGRKLGPAWAAIWAELEEAAQHEDPFVEGRDMADRIGPDYGLAGSTLVALLSRAARAGLVDTTSRPVLSGRGHRNRTFYRARVKTHA